MKKQGHASRNYTHSLVVHYLEAGKRTELFSGGKDIPIDSAYVSKRKLRGVSGPVRRK